MQLLQITDSVTETANALPFARAKPLDLLTSIKINALLSGGFSFTGTEVVKSEFR
jgi:hypothetical protein